MGSNPDDHREELALQWRGEATQLGIKVHLYGEAPVQAEGTFDDQSYYFRARGSHWSFECYEGGANDPEPPEDEMWRTGGDYGRQFAASYMPDYDALARICQSVQQFRMERNRPAGNHADPRDGSEGMA